MGEFLINYIERTHEHYHNTWINGQYWEKEASVLKAAADRILDAWLKACEIYTSYHFKNINDSIYILCEDEIQMFPTYMLLMGYALENIIKGIIITKMSLSDPDSIKTKNFGELKFCLKNGTNRDIKTHHFTKDLLEAKVIDILSSDREKELFNEIEACVIWGGKYPTPKELRLNKHFVSPTGAITMSTRKPEEIKALYKKWSTELHKLNGQIIEITEKTTK